LSHSSSSTKEDPTGNHPSTKIVGRTEWQQTLNGGSCNTLPFLDNFNSELIHKYVTDAGATTTTTTIYTFTGPDNQHLDRFLFHQKLAPYYIPEFFKSASSGLLQGGTLNPQMAINGEPDEEITNDSAIQEDVLSIDFSSHSTDHQGTSYQTEEEVEIFPDHHDKPELAAHPS
jgi:hypothetical protein